MSITDGKMNSNTFSLFWINAPNLSFIWILAFELHWDAIVFIYKSLVTYHFLGLSVDFLTLKKITLWEYDN